MIAHDTLTVLDRQLLLQLGDRLKRLRKAQDLGTVEMAKRAGVSRTTLSAVESGDPSPSMGTYLRVMSVLGVSGELALLAGDTLHPAPPGSAAARSRRGRPVVQVLVSSDESRHRIQDLQSLALHQEAIRAIQRDPSLLDQAKDTLHHWLATRPGSRTAGLWRDWEQILMARTWRKVLGHTRRAQELRQASPLPTVLPEDIRQHVLLQVSKLKKGIVLGDDLPLEAT
jgi:transcriptional regulator with XRE-family HTH domain